MKIVLPLRYPHDRARFLGSALIFVCLLSPMASARAQSLPAALQADFEGGVTAVQAGRLDEAEKAFLHVLQQGGKVSFVYNNLGIVYQMRGNHKAAVAQFREAIRLDPHYAAPRILLGASLLALGEDEEAARELERAVKIQPLEPLAHGQLAEAYKRTGNYAGVVEQYQLLHSLQPHDPEVLYQLGRAYSDQAEWCLREIRRIDPKSACLYESLGENYRLQGHLDLAQSAYQRAAASDPKRPGIHLALAQIFLQQGQTVEARKEIQEELAIVPESVAAQALAKKISAAGSK